MEIDEYQPIIGLEVHVELATNSKMFCSCSADYFGKEPNTHCCPVCLGLPGALPVPNRKAVEWCVMLGMALNCQIAEFSKFDRKNYFYPDLPKGYQISQYDKPFAINGWLIINNPITQSSNNPIIETLKKKIRIRRVHLEEDTGKLIHAKVDGEKCTLVDFNRSGVPLVEIVTEPDFRRSEEAKVFLKKLHQIIRYLGISDADMEKGSLRIEPNVSILKISNDKFHSSQALIPNNQLPKYKVEIKNINSFNFAKKAIDYEIERQIKFLKRGETPIQETRGWNEKKGKTVSQRGKEEAHDYRYFPEPDIPPIRWLKKKLDKIRSQIGELPDDKMNRLVKAYKLSLYDAKILVDNKNRADYFESAVRIGKKKDIKAKLIANWIINKRVDNQKIPPKALIEKIIKETKFEELPQNQLEEIIQQVIKNNPKAVKDYCKGKRQSIMFLVGQVMKNAKGKADAQKIRKLLHRKMK